MFKFNVGDAIKKFGGSYQHTGTIVAAFSARDGLPRYVVDYDAPVEGMLHIHGETQLEKVGE